MLPRAIALSRKRQSIGHGVRDGCWPVGRLKFIFWLPPAWKEGVVKGL